MSNLVIINYLRQKYTFVHLPFWQCAKILFNPAFKRFRYFSYPQYFHINIGGCL